MTGEPTCLDAQPARAWRLPAWTWIILHFAFVASLATVWHRREAWIEMAQVPGMLSGVNTASARPLLLVMRELEYATVDVVYDIERRQDLMAFVHYGRGSMSSALSPDGRSVLTLRSARDPDLQAGAAVVLWSIASGKELWSLGSPLQSEDATSPDVTVGFALNGKRVVVSHYGGDHDMTRVLDSANGQELVRISEAIPPDQDIPIDLPLLVTSSPPHDVWHVRDMTTGRAACAIHQFMGPLVLVPPSGSTALNEQYEIAEYDCRTGQRLRLFGSGGIDIALSRDGDFLLVSEMSRIRTYDLGRGSMLAEAPGSHFSALSQDGRRIATFPEVNGEESWRIVDARDGATLAELLRCPLDEATFSYAVFSLDGNYLAASSGAYTLVFRRRFPEWWWGHIYRPEVWAAMVLGAAWLWSAIRWARGQLRERRAAG